MVGAGPIRVGKASAQTVEPVLKRGGSRMVVWRRMQRRPHAAVSAGPRPHRTRRAL